MVYDGRKTAVFLLDKALTKPAVFVDLQHHSRPMQRVRDALIQYLPNTLKVTSNRDEANLVVLHIQGRCDHNHLMAEHITKRGQKLAVIQYCIRSTKQPETTGWTKLWGMASVVWSYLNIPALLTEDNSLFELSDFYYSPLGVSKDFGACLTSDKKFLIGTSGRSWLSESVREVANAAWRVNERVFHLGPVLHQDSRITFLQGMNDQELSKLWASCKYISGLRRTEGFEFPTAEGLVCGARPVLFNRDHYKMWYGDLAEYIPEGSRMEVIESLEALFRGPYRWVTLEERIEARRRFNWERIIRGFWERCLPHILG